MNRKVISAAVAVAMTATMSSFALPANAAEVKTPQYQTNARQMEKLNRGLIAVKTTADTRGQAVNGVYLSWRLLGDECLENQAFDIYKNGTKIHTTGVHDATNWIDTSGTASDKYKVVKAGEDASKETEVTPTSNNNCAKSNEVGNGNSEKNSFTYVDIPISRPDPVERMGDGKISNYYTVDKSHEGGANDASVGDLDGDGNYEIVLKWDPTDSKDSAGADFTGNAYIDAYKIDPNNDGYMWRIDLGKNVTSGAHYTQFLVYDFDGDGKSEVAMKTAPGTVDGTGHYVTEVGDTDEIRNTDNTKSYIGTSGRLKGKNPNTQYLTIIDGETGAALYTTDYIPYDAAEDKYWGDGKAKYNRSERYLAAVAYLDGVHPSVVMTRGYYTYVYAAAYTWDGTDLKEQWLSTNTPTEANGGTGCTVKYADGTSKNNTNKTLYAQGAHSVSVADVDNDGYDEIIFGSAVLDHDGTVLTYDGRGHGDAEHVSDFDNDGKQEIFMAHEAGKHNDKIIPYAVDIKRYNGDIMLQAAQGDIGRGIMDNVDDEYALSSGNLSLFWSVAADGIYNQAGEKVGNIPNTNGSNMENFAVYWDGDLGRELLDGNKLVKYSIKSGTERIYYDSKNSTLPGSINNSTKSNACLTADLFGDWREEIVLRYGDGVRIYFSTIPTDYRLTTLMHDSQYRCAIAWQNVGYNQSPHTSYYIGSAALAKDSGGNTLNYLAPNTSFTEVTYPDTSSITPRPTIKTTPEPVSVSVTPDADTYLVDGTTAHGSDEELKINQATAYYSSTSPGLKDIKGLGLIRFDLSKYAGKKLTSATLKLYDKFTNTEERNSVLHLDYCSKNDWDEATVTINDIKTRGEDTPLSSLGLQVSPAYNVDYKEISFDVTDVIKEKCTDNLITFTLWTGTGREQVIASKE